MSEAQQQNVTIDLAQPRVVSFKAGKFVYEYHFKRLTKEAWLAYFASMHVTSERDSGGVKNVVDVATAGSNLVRDNVDSVVGYVAGFTEHENWRDILPPGHLKLVAAAIQDVEVAAPSDDGPIDPCSIAVNLNATWTATNPGEMQKVCGLVHRFSPPTAAHDQKYNRALSETRVVGGGRNGTTIYPSRQAFLVQLYDELVQSVDGYTWNGAPFDSEREIIIREMDAFHKVTAVRQLFVEPEVE